MPETHAASDVVLRDFHCVVEPRIEEQVKRLLNESGGRELIGEAHVLFNRRTNQRGMIEAPADKIRRLNDILFDHMFQDGKPILESDRWCWLHTLLSYHVEAICEVYGES